MWKMLCTAWILSALKPAGNGCWERCWRTAALTPHIEHSYSLLWPALLCCWWKRRLGARLIYLFDQQSFVRCCSCQLGASKTNVFVYQELFLWAFTAQNHFVSTSSCFRSRLCCGEGSISIHAPREPGMLMAKLPGCNLSLWWGWKESLMTLLSSSFSSRSPCVCKIKPKHTGSLTSSL